MFLSIFQIALACMLWGAIFALPLFLEAFSYIDIVLGRFLVYGLLSLLVIVYYSLQKNKLSFLAYWKQAALIALVMNFIHFGSLTVGIRFTSASLITLIMGASPLTIILFDSWIKKDMSLLSIFILPTLSIVLGLGFMNLEALQNEVSDVSITGYLQGVFWGVVALLTWTWYVVYNGNFMQRHTDVTGYQWTALVGLATLLISLLGIAFQYWLHGIEYFYQFYWMSESALTFYGAILFLGIFCSWVAFALWSAASSSISSALAGQLSILETIFGLIFVYTIQSKIPSFTESIGIALILFGISYALYQQRKYDTSPNL